MQGLRPSLEEGSLVAVADRGEGPAVTEQTLEGCSHEPRSTSGCCQHQKLGQSHEKDSLSASPRRNRPCWLLDFGLLASRAVRTSTETHRHPVSPSE